MYVPAAFRETDREKLFDLIEQYSFGLLVSQAGNEPFATHLPMLLDRGAGLNGRLIGHMARANPHWQTAAGQTALAVFSGPHAYVSPTWYEADNVVPTWNYVAVHVYGTFQAIEETARLLEIVGKYVKNYEAPFPQPWKFDPASPYSQKLAQAIVGFEIDITRIEGKWKLNQNQPPERRERVVRALRASGSPADAAVADLIAEQLAQSPRAE
jgi:transcriptional regulator